MLPVNLLFLISKQPINYFSLGRLFAKEEEGRPIIIDSSLAGEMKKKEKISAGKKMTY